jgi:HD-GYP domain-containing protein (c-di-GMP phosphodiesterase class II)
VSSTSSAPHADSFAQIRLTRSGLLAPVVVLILTISAIAGVWLLVGQVSSSREAQLRVSSQTLVLADLQSAPFNADPAAGGSGTASLIRIRADEGSISRALTAHAQVGVLTSLLSAGRVDLGAIAPVVLRIYGLAVRPGGLSGAGALIPKLQGTLTVRAADLGSVLSKIGQADAARATAAHTEATLGAAGAMLLLLAAFGYFYFRSVAAHQAVERLAGDKEALLGISCSEARTDALTSLGEGWDIGCSHGVAWTPSEAATESHALTPADERMYANIAGRASTCRQVTDVLLQVITEQDASLDLHVERVSELAGTLAAALGQPEPETERIRLAAKLHDIGKTAIPAALLDKPSPLNEHEWEFVHRHPVIGARIVSAAPALANTAPMIRSSHERIDGHGYPDGLTGENIPLGSRIIAVCDAYETMTSDRLYQPGLSVDAALEELKRHADTQFDARIVKIFSDIALYRSSPSEPDPKTITTSTTLNPRHTWRSRRRPETGIGHLRRPS